MSDESCESMELLEEVPLIGPVRAGATPFPIGRRMDWMTR